MYPVKIETQLKAAPSSFSFATGIEFREGSLLIGPKCAVRAKEGRYSRDLHLYHTVIELCSSYVP